MKTTHFFAVTAAFYLLAAPAEAHRSGCHRWHSCPSDSGSYVCGDLGYTSSCPTSTPAPRPAVSLPAANPPATSATRITTTGVNLRAEPSARSAKIATLARGTRVNLISCAASWCRVTVAGKRGYVAQAYLR